MTRISPGPLPRRVFQVIALAFLAAAFALLLVVNATAPVTNGLALFSARNNHVSLNGGRPVVRFGTYGFCLQVYHDFSYDSSSGATPDRCSSPAVGYDVLNALSPVTPSVGASVDQGERALTQTLVLHPLATGFSFLALVFAALPSRLVPLIIAPTLTTLAAALTLAALICDTVLFNLLRQRLLRSRTSAVGNYDIGFWLVVAAFVCLFCATVLLGLRWVLFILHQRRVRNSEREEAELEQQRRKQHEDVAEEDNTYRNSESAAAAAAPPYEMGDKAGPVEVDGRHEKGRIELADKERHELDNPASYSEPKSRVVGTK